MRKKKIKGKTGNIYSDAMEKKIKDPVKMLPVIYILESYI